MVVNDDKDLAANNEDLYENTDFFNTVQKFLDNNIRIVRNFGWVIGVVGVVVIIRRTYALHHFTNPSAIPENYFNNNVTLAGKVLKVHDNGQLGVQHIPLLWKARLKWISKPYSTLLTINITGVELRNGGIDYLASLLQDSNIKFKLLGKGNCETIESIVFQNKSWFKEICINEDVIGSGFAVASHVPSLSHVKAYNQLTERLIKAEVKAVKKKTGIWKDDTQKGILHRTWYWLKSKFFKT